MPLQVPAHRAADDGEEQVVDRRAVEMRARALHLGEREADRLHHAVRRHRAVEAGHRRLGECGQRRALRRAVVTRLELAHDLLEREAAHALQRAEIEPGNAAGAGHAVGDRPRVELDAGRVAFGIDRRVPGQRLVRIRRQRVHRLQQRGAGLAVDRRMVELEEDRERAVGQAGNPVQALDDVDLPQRPAAIERARMQARDLDHQLPPVARLGQGDVADVELEIGVGVVDPVRTVERVGHRHQAPAEDLVHVEAAAEVGQDVLEADLAAPRGGRIVDAERRDVVVDVAALGVEKEVVRSRKLFHGVLV